MTSTRRHFVRRKHLIFVVIIISLLILSFIYGVMVGEYHYPPYNVSKTISDKLLGVEEKRQKAEEEKRQKAEEEKRKKAEEEKRKKAEEFIYYKIDPEYWKTDVNSLISIKSESDILEKRSRLIRYIWGDKDFPVSKMPSNIEKNIKRPRYSDLSNLKTIDKIVVAMDYGLNSIIYHFHPVQSNNQLIVYHQGDRGEFIVGKSTIQFFLDKGYSVLAFSMPLLGMNNRPTVDLERFGRLKLENHDHLKFLDHPIKFFVEPIAVALNYATQEFRHNSIHMVGKSGGGWTATLYAAIDPRISKSYPVAGTYPIYLRLTRDWGDYEQTLPELYQIANYLELYILGSYGDGRKQLQVINQYDPCCFAGVKYQIYEKEVASLVSHLGKGEFEVYLDDTHKEHKISEHALRIIIKDIEEK